jgi:5-methylcytosine-specific restriction endonuclease McrA
MQNTQVLVLNKLYQPVHVTHARRALCLMYVGAAYALDHTYKPCDFDTWLGMGIRENDDVVKTVDRHIRIPRIVVLNAYDKIPSGRVRFSRHTLFVRDRFTCQYCGKVCARRELNLDHVIPKSQGGGTHWENVVTSCIACNDKKGSRTPEQAAMPLLCAPKKPRWIDLVQPYRCRVRYSEWSPFITIEAQERIVLEEM